MKKRNIFFSLLEWGFRILIFPQPFQAQEPACGFEWALEKQMDLDASGFQRFAGVNRTLEKFVKENEGHVYFRNEMVIPVVVHVVWNGPEENVSDETILTQIEALNRDFNGENGDLADVPNEFQPFIAKSGIRFCLAAEGPQGLPTSGITRTGTDIGAIGTNEDLYSLAPAWDTERYLNIWVANTGEFITGFGTYPAQVGEDRQGVVVHPKYFGENNSRRYNFGRVAVHEVGHYLGLNHIWDGNGDCNTDDGVADTPLQQLAYLGCPAHPQTSCGSHDMFMNFMDYVDDGCMVMFTQGQMERMIATVEIFRPGLLGSGVSCIQAPEKELDSGFLIYPNPAKGELTIDFPSSVAEVGTLEIYSTTGQLVYENKMILRNKMRVGLRGLVSGIYWVKIGGKVKKLVVR